jgi:hypothetical protein
MGEHYRLTAVRSLLVVPLVFAASVASAGTYEIHPGDNLYQRLGMLQPGDEVIVHAGTYTTPGYVSVTWAGTAAQPIIVRGADGEARPVIEGTFAQNTMNLGGSYFTLKGFEIRGGSHGLRLQTVSNALLENLVLHDLGDVGISCNQSPNNCDALTIRHCEIYNTGKEAGGTGEGMYLGCNDASCQITNSIIENNYVHDMGGDQGDGIEVKPGSYGNIVRDNVIVRSKYPGITMYGYTGTGPVNVVERNLVWHVTVDAGIQTVGQVIVRNNIVIDTASYGIFSKPSNGHYPHDITIVHNTVVSSATSCLRTSSWSTETNQVVANNAFYCPNGTTVDINGGASASAIITNNAIIGSSTLAADLGDATTSVYPPAGSALINEGAVAQAAADDFNGTARSDGIPDIGAYEVTNATNPGWPLGEGFKTPPAINVDGPSGGGDAGVNPTASDSGCCSASSRPRNAWLALVVLGLMLRRRRRA